MDPLPTHHMVIHRRQHWAILGDKHSGARFWDWPSPNECRSSQDRSPTSSTTPGRRLADAFSSRRGRRFSPSPSILSCSRLPTSPLAELRRRWMPYSADLLNGQSIETVPFQVDPQWVDESIYCSGRTQADKPAGNRASAPSKYAPSVHRRAPKVRSYARSCRNPPLILDDPCGGLDPAARTRLLGTVDLFQHRTELTPWWSPPDPKRCPTASHFAIVHTPARMHNRRDEHPSSSTHKPMSAVLSQVGHTNIPCQPDPTDGWYGAVRKDPSSLYQRHRPVGEKPS
jgi:hypothetical protein